MLITILTEFYCNRAQKAAIKENQESPNVSNCHVLIPEPITAEDFGIPTGIGQAQAFSWGMGGGGELHPNHTD